MNRLICLFLIFAVVAQAMTYQDSRLYDEYRIGEEGGGFWREGGGFGRGFGGGFGRGGFGFFGWRMVAWYDATQKSSKK